MRAVNHALTGALIGLTVSQPVVAILAALGSHFLLDALPHHGMKRQNDKLFRQTLILDGLACFLIVLLLFTTQPANWLLACICAFLATSPDFMWLKPWLREQRHKRPKPYNLAQRFHSKIQWAEKPHNYPYEVIWFFGALFLLVKAV